MRVFVVMISLLSVVISQKNLAPNGIASQSTIYYWKDKNVNLTADLAIAGEPTYEFFSESCATTLYEPFQRFSWWMLTFPVDTVYITNVQIYYRDNTLQNLVGYSLYISNSSTSKTDGHLCYHHEGSEHPNKLQNKNCNHLGKNVIFYNERKESNNPTGYTNYSILEICYIEVNGCYKGWWNSNCTTPCPVNCIGNHCFPGNGSCIWGCKIGLREDHCDTPCVPGTFGNQCSSNCHCVNQPCDPVDGTCSAGGCQPGYKGNTCSTDIDFCIGDICVSGTFGNNCTSICHCINQPCNHEHGTCPAGGFERGYEGITCSTACSSGKFGNQCSSICHCVNQPCNPIIGTCPAGGCQRGYKGTTCSIACVSGTFGNNCASICHCVNQPCNHEHGTCPAGGCQRGYEGITCSTECSFGNFSYNCSQSCDGCLSGACESKYGHCINQSGCKPGWKYDQPGQVKCDIECGSGTFGNNCSSNCHCVNQPCDPEHGTCPAGGCQRGYKGSTCSIKCDLGNYGYNCDQSCDGCLSDSCDKESGVCTNTTGCKLGWQYGQELKCDKKCVSGTFGDQCSKSCHCVNQPCDLQNGTCPDGGCESGYNGSTCSIVCNDGHFGMNCESRCYCNYGYCNTVSGNCQEDKCQKGWTGMFCNEECDNGTYGYDCANQCNTCQNTSCERFEGNCTYDCIEGYTGHLCRTTEAKLPPSESQKTNIGPIAGGIGGVVVAIVLVVILVFLIRYRSANKKAKYHESGGLTPTNKEENTYANDMRATVKTGDVNISLLPSTSHKTEQVYNNTVPDDDDNNGEATYGNVQHNEVTTKYRIRVTELQNVISDKHTNNGFLKEYEILPRGLVRPHDEGQKEGNKIKNRFLNTLPYDHSRVIIHGSTTSDYINANYIDSYTAEKAYIASQGPKSNTMKDFWQMIWQERVDKIVMVTQLVERRVVKCHQYWPESSFTPLEVGNIKVQMMQEKEHTVYVYRMIKLFNKEAKAERTVHHFHFTQWPDHGVPDKIKLVSFYRKVKRTKTALNGPLTVHCSAGVGRTGTFIALDALYEHGQKTGYVDIMEFVQMMRKDRMNMIQTKDQYTAVYEVLLEALTVSDTAIDKDTFCEHLDSHQNKPKAKNQTLLWQEFQKLQDTKPTYPDTFFLAATSRANIDKNAFQNILPHDSYRPFLMSYGRSRNDYINAVIIPECIGKRNILVTQYPLQDTVVDFWTMVYDTDSTVVVVLEVLNENVPLWPNHGDAFHYDKFNISNSSESSSFPLDITLEHKETNKSKTICVVSMTEWNTDNIPSSGTCMLDILNNVSSWRDDHPGSVTVVCRDGCKRSGVFAALSLVLEKIEIDDEVDIFQVVRTMQVRRPEFFPNVDQYEYCYQSIKEHLEENSIYVNA